MDSEFFDKDALYRWEFNNKGYPHFDSYFCESRVEKILCDLQKNNKISHPFYPLIRFEMPKHKRDETGRVYKTEQPRYIMHTARIDSNIYSFYRNILMNAYEIILSKNKISDYVIGYRKIATGKGNNKCNLHFANEAIDEIINQLSKRNNCTAIALDISGFFDNLDHQLIKKQWCRVMDFRNELSKDHYTIYKNITRYTYIDAKKLEEVLQIKFSNIRKFKKKQLCSPDIFKKKISKYLSKRNRIGIPQGATISDVIANIYMINFDLIMKKFSIKYEAYYRRYSDDILFVCPLKYQDRAIKFIKRSIKKICKTLEISDRKTQVSKFIIINDEIVCSSYNHEGENIAKPFEYLGLSFDGKSKSIRQSTMSAFYRKLSKKIKKEIQIALYKLENLGISDPLPEEIYKKISFNRIRNSYMENREENHEKKYFGNFFTYIHLACKITGNSAISKPYKRLGPWIKKRARKYCERIQFKGNHT